MDDESTTLTDDEILAVGDDFPAASITDDADGDDTDTTDGDTDDSDTTDSDGDDSDSDDA